jgi:hypothetical protein
VITNSPPPPPPGPRQSSGRERAIFKRNRSGLSRGQVRASARQGWGSRGIDSSCLKPQAAKRSSYCTLRKKCVTKCANIGAPGSTGVHGAGGAPRQAQVLTAGAGMASPAGVHSCRQECKFRQECNCRTAIAFSCPQWTPAPAGGRPAPCERPLVTEGGEIRPLHSPQGKTRIPRMVPRQQPEPERNHRR